MQESDQGQEYHPNHPFPIPYTIISTGKNMLMSQPVAQPFYYEVYCPLKCKKIKIGFARNKEHELCEFNSTTHRVVSVHANENLRYLINTFPPVNKQVKKKITKEKWNVCIEVQDQGNVAIFNPYCVDVTDPLSLYSYSQLRKVQIPIFLTAEEFSQPYTHKGIEIILKKNKVYLSEDLNYISANTFFGESSEDEITLQSPYDPHLAKTFKTREIYQLLDNNLSYWGTQLRRHIEIKTNKLTIDYNLDEIYQQLNVNLNLLEQMRARLMSKKHSALYQQWFPYHPRLYSAFERLGSFINYGNTKYDVNKLAKLGFFNKSDMLQNLSYVELPLYNIPTAEEELVMSEDELLKKLFPFCRRCRELPFPDVPIERFVQSMPAQKMAVSPIVKYQCTDPYLVVVSKEGKVSVWNTELMVYKMFEFDFCSFYSKDSPIPLNQKDVAEEEGSITALFSDKQDAEQSAEPETKEVEPDKAMLQKLISMGYGPGTVLKALKQVKNESIPAALDAIQQIQSEEKAQAKTHPRTKNWSCKYCTYNNPATNQSCEMCKQIYSGIEEQEESEESAALVQLAIRQEEKQKAERERKQRDEKEKESIEFLKQQQKQLEILRQQEVRASEILDLKLFRISKSAIDPFIVCILFRSQKSSTFLRVFRIGINRARLLKVYRLEGESVVSNLTRKIYEQPTLETINDIVGESRYRIEAMSKIFQPANDKDWEVMKSIQIVLQNNSINKIQVIKQEFITVYQDGCPVDSFELLIFDELKKQGFQLRKTELIGKKEEEVMQQIKQIKPEQRPINTACSDSVRYSDNSIEIGPDIEEITIQVTEHLPKEKWQRNQASDTKPVTATVYAENIVMSEFLPLKIEAFEGSLYSHQYASTNIQSKTSSYISNYPEVNFVLKSIDCKPMMIESVSMISTLSKSEKSRLIQSGLIFTANEPSWFHLAKKRFRGMQKQQYEQWLRTKHATNSKPAFWEPVAFFELQGEIEFQILHKRVAKYIFLLSTTPSKKNGKDQVIALKLHFLGVKGRIEQKDSCEESMMIQHYNDEGSTGCQITIEEASDGWKPIPQSGCFIKKASSPNGFYYLPPEAQADKTPMTVSTLYHIQFQQLGRQKKINVDSSYLKNIRAFEIKKSQGKKQSIECASFEQLAIFHHKLGAFQLTPALQKLNTEDLVLGILQGKKAMTQYQSLLNKIYGMPDQFEKLAKALLQMLPRLCEEGIKISEKGFKPFLRAIEKLTVSHEQQLKQSICDTWVSIIDFMQICRNKNYNILRNEYGIDTLVLQPALFSKEYYRMIDPNSPEEERSSSFPAGPQTPLNHYLYVQNLTNQHYVYFIDTLGHDNLKTLQLYFPRLQTNNRSKMSIRVCELVEKAGCLSEKQVYYRFEHEDLLLHLSHHNVKDTEIYQSSCINYLTVPLPATSSRILKLYVDFALLATKPQLATSKPMANPYYIIPLLISQKRQDVYLQNHPYSEPVNKILASFPDSANHCSTDPQLPFYRFASQGNRRMFEVHELRNRLEEQSSKNQFSETIDKITQNIMDAKIVHDNAKNMRINDYSLGYKGLDFAYTLMINAIKIFRKLPATSQVDLSIMFLLFDNFVVYESGPIMTYTVSALIELFSRLDEAQKNVFVERIIDKYLGDCSAINSLKISEKYPVGKIITFLCKLSMPFSKLFEKLAQTQSVFSVLILLKLLLNNLSKQDISDQSGAEENKIAGRYQTYELYQIAFNKCIWILDNVTGLKSQLLETCLDLLLKLVGINGEAAKSQKQVKESQSQKKSLGIFLERMQEKDFWKLIFLTLKINKDCLKEQIHTLFGLVVDNLTGKLQKSINSMLLEIIRKEEGSLYHRISLEISDDARMSHLQTILQYLSLTNSKIFLDTDTATCLLSLPLTPALWSLALKIIPREESILKEIINNFNPQNYSSLDLEFMDFCSPLTGIRPLSCKHINWLQLVKQIKIEGKTIFQLFIESLQHSSFGGRVGLKMPLASDVVQLERTNEFAQLVLEQKLGRECFSPSNIKTLISWYFLNFTKEEGDSPATDLIKKLSGCVERIFENLSQDSEIIQQFLKATLQSMKEGDILANTLEQKKISANSALNLNRKFSECFGNLVNIFASSDELSDYFAFEIDGLQYMLEKIGLHPALPMPGTESTPAHSISHKMMNEQDFLVSHGLIVLKADEVLNAMTEKTNSALDFKEEQFANNVKLVPKLNEHSVSAVNTDWTIYKKGSKTKIIFLPMIGPTYHEYSLYIQFNRVAEIRSIKIGFPAASYEFGDKLVASPSGVIIEGSIDNKCYEPLGEMVRMNDDGYFYNGVVAFTLNLEKIQVEGLSIREVVKSFGCHRAKYLKIILRRPIVAYIQGQYSPLHGKKYKNLGINISFLSVTGDDVAKLPCRLVGACNQISKECALNLLGMIINESNPNTIHKIANDSSFTQTIKSSFNAISQLIKSYPSLMPGILHLLGSNNEQLGDWIINRFLTDPLSQGQLQASLINQIITSSPARVHHRMSIFAREIWNRLDKICRQSEIESGFLFSASISLIDSFCKTLEQSFDLQGAGNFTPDCTFESIKNIISIYDNNYSSPQIKTLIKFLLSALYTSQHTQASTDMLNRTLEMVWNSCSEVKPYFYSLLAALLVHKRAQSWIQRDNHSKIKDLIQSIKKSIQAGSVKIVEAQIYLFTIFSLHEQAYIRENTIYLHLYNLLKTMSLEDDAIFNSLAQVMKAVVLGHPKDVEIIAAQLVDDVPLLVKSKDPRLQKFYTSMLALEKQVYVNIKGFELESSNKDILIPTKMLSKKLNRALVDEISKKIKFSLNAEFEFGKDALKNSSGLYSQIMTAINCPQFLMLARLKLANGNYAYCGCYSPAKATKAEQESYFWEDYLPYEEGAFVFFISQGKIKYYKNLNLGQHMLSLFGCEESVDDHLVLYEQGRNRLAEIMFNSPEQSSFNFDNCDACQIEQIQLFNGSFKPMVSDSAKLNAFSSKVNVPYSYYRTSDIYVFPAEFTVEKLTNIIGIKGVYSNRNHKIDRDATLEQLQKETEDMIVDMGFQAQDIGCSNSQDSEYQPILSIFEHYQRLGGISQVLEIGSKSIKDWTNKSRSKNFQRYLSEIKMFVNLPNFFSLFTKNQEAVSFLFQIASGMPDDPNSTEAWEQQELKSSRFIYKTLADIFHLDRSLGIRDLDKYLEICRISLQKLAQISKEIVRKYEEDSDSEEDTLELMKVEKKKSEEQKNKKKKKGIGYGVDNNSKWSANQWVEHRNKVSLEIRRVIGIFVNFLNCQKPLTDQRIGDMIKNSCLLPLLESALRSGSLLDISKQAGLFRDYLSIIKNLARNPATLSCLLVIDKKYRPSQTESLQALLTKLNDIAEIFISCLDSKKDDKNHNDDAAIIAYQIKATYRIVDQTVKSIGRKADEITIQQLNKMPVSKAYGILLGKLRFGYIDIKSENTFKHFYANKISTGAPSTAKILRLSQELADLSSSLPCENTNSIFVRCDKSRIDVIKILVMGSKDTPYSNGAFMFDLYCDDNYPNNPPMMSITTTGGGKIRFNPNLYSCGKVCLSLLGTWRGHATENWDAKLSTLLQLLISTQGITMSEEVYFNEPGFDSEQGTPEGEKKNQAYSNIVRLGNVRYAMNEQIKNPPQGFESIINRHFYIKKKEIIAQVSKWIEWADRKEASYTGLINDHNSSWCTQLKATKSKYKELLTKEFEELKELLDKLPEPSLHQEEEDENFKVQKKKKRSKAKEVKLGDIDVTYDLVGANKLKYQEDVIQDRWSRYIGAMGVEAVRKQSQSCVLLLGLKSLGLQIAKNLVLSGLKELTIVEDDILSMGSEQHFYMSDMKGKKIENCIYKIKELNPYMLVRHEKQLPKQLSRFNVVISTLTMSQSLKISEHCIKLGTMFMHAQTAGVSGLFFAGLGPEFSIHDSNGEEPFEALIKNISCEANGIVTLMEGLKHPYEDGDYIAIQKVSGMDVIQQKMQDKSDVQAFYDHMSKNASSASINGKVFRVKIISWNSFSIGDTTNFKPYIRNGLCKNIKVPKKVNYKPFQECVSKFEEHLDINLGMYDFEKMGENYSIFACFLAEAKFRVCKKRGPMNWDSEDLAQFLQIVKAEAVKDQKSQEEIEKILNFSTKFGCVAEAQLPVLSAYLGGIASQEVIKALTNKYTPIKQFFTFHANELMQSVPQEANKFKQLHVKPEQPFANLKIVVGKQNAAKIEKSKTFVVGAGAIGCELLKNFAMASMGSQGAITVTDPDHIETSNLSRQFLFRQKHVKKPKSAIAAATLIQINPLLQGHVSARLDKVCEETEDVYSQEFLESQTLVANALDNVRARVYVDKRCVQSRKPLFESGTLGAKGHVQVIVPHETENYGNQTDPAQENQIPHCTLKMFPEETVHCIEWSRDIFGKLFTLNPKALKKIIDSKDPHSLQGDQRQTVRKMIQHRPMNFEECVGEAVRKFYIYYRNNVRQLMHTYPADMKTKEGKLFWELPKRPPKQIAELDSKDELHSTFITSYAVLLARVYGIPYPPHFRKQESKEQVMKIAVGVKVEDFVPSEEESVKLHKLNEEAEAEKNKSGQEPQGMMPIESMPKKPIESVPEKPALKVQPQLKLDEEILSAKIVAEEFEKDEDSNGHIDLIYSMSNLRARNYGLKQCTWIEAKLKAGKIMAALSTTTSAIAALQTLQILKFIVGSKSWRNAFVNLAVPLLQISEPGQANKYKIAQTEFTVWDTWQFKCENLKQLLQQIRVKYKAEGYNISTAEGKPVFWETMYVDKEQARENLLNKPLKQIFDGAWVQLNILMRELQQTEGVKKSYSNVPRIRVQISQT